MKDYTNEYAEMIINNIVTERRKLLDMEKHGSEQYLIDKQKQVLSDMEALLVKLRSKKSNT